MAAKKKTGSTKGCGIKNGCKSRKGGLTAKGRKRINAKTGSNLKAPVTGKVKPGSKDAKRRKSFCARSRGWTGERGKPPVVGGNAKGKLCRYHSQQLRLQNQCQDIMGTKVPRKT